MPRIRTVLSWHVWAHTRNSTCDAAPGMLGELPGGARRLERVGDCARVAQSDGRRPSAYGSAGAPDSRRGAHRQAVLSARTPASTGRCAAPAQHPAVVRLNRPGFRGGHWVKVNQRRSNACPNVCAASLRAHRELWVCIGKADMSLGSLVYMKQGRRENCAPAFEHEQMQVAAALLGLSSLLRSTS